MLIGSRQRLSALSDTLELSIDNIPIEQVSSVKSFGIYIDENLTCHSHIDKLCKKIASAIGATLITAALSGVIVVKHHLTSYKNYTTVLHE